MAYFSYLLDTGQLLQISDMDIDVTDGTAVCSNTISKATLEAHYTWDQSARDFVIRRDAAKLSKLEFLRKFTPQERIAIREASKTDPVIFDAMEMVNLAEFISLTDQDTINMVGYFAQQGLLAPNRIQEILG
jgi:hypothetical protein